MINRLQDLSVRIKIMVALGLVVSITLGLTFFWMAQRQEAQIMQQVNVQAKTIFANVVLVRAWAAGQGQGGVFVEKIGAVQTNPYLLQVPGLIVDIEDTNSMPLTLRNPALITRELSELGQVRNEKFSFRITSLNPFNPNNIATEWEAIALNRFEQGEKEAFTVDNMSDGDPVYRYMAPLEVTEACLRCHAEQGYKVGDIRGGISVTVPLAEAQAAIDETRQQMLMAGVGTTVAALFILYVVINLLVIRPLQLVEETARDIIQGRLDRRVPLKAGDELGSLAVSFNQMTTQLQQSLTMTEQQVERRTHRLQIAADLAEHFSAILDFDVLLGEIVNQVKDSFEYYHVHIYILDETRMTLQMVEGAGVPGAKMKASGHSIPLNISKSLVARAARTGQTVVVDNVRADKNWLPNPLLPDTHSEMAVPIVLKEQVVGVLDVQQAQIAGFDEGDASLLRSLAGQIAVALNNARIFAQVEASLQQAREAQDRYTTQAWSNPGNLSTERRHLYVAPTAPENLTKKIPVPFESLPQSEPVIIREHDNPDGNSEMSGDTSLVAPVKLGDKTIGTFRAYLAQTSGDNQSPPQWAEKELELVQAVLDQVAIAAENLRLFDETQQRAGREQTTRQIIEKMRASPDIESIINIGIKELSTALNTDRVYVRLSAKADPNNFDLNFDPESTEESFTQPVVNGTRGKHNSDNLFSRGSTLHSKRK